MNQFLTKLFYKIILFITYTIFQFIYFLLTTIETLLFILKTHKYNTYVSNKFKQYCMSKLFDYVYNRCLGAKRMWINPLSTPKYKLNYCPCGSRRRRSKSCCGREKLISKKEYDRLMTMIRKEEK